jgi:uncharacterized protein YecE (DUF72 family)
MPLLPGTSGWQYRHWRGRFYPPRLATARWLEFYAERFATVEVNAAFYRLPQRSVFESWAARTPGDFVMTVKASRYLTHIRRLSEPREPVERLLERAVGLGSKLGVILVQLPPDFTVDVERLAATLACFPPGVRVAVEPRHPSWWIDEVRDLLAAFDAALCWADRRGRPVTPLWRTASWGYLRLHEGPAQPWPNYDDESLAAWARIITERFPPSADLYLYGNNDPDAAALRDVVRLADMLAGFGWASTRHPALATLRALDLDSTAGLA